MSSILYAQLLALSDADREIVLLSNRKADTEAGLKSRQSAISQEKQRLVLLDKAHSERAQRQTAHESKLREAEKRVVERRKQLNDMGGAKAAKNLEREIDASTKFISGLEEELLKLMDDAEKAKAVADTQRALIERLEGELAGELEKAKTILTEVEEKLSGHVATRDALAAETESVSLRLYDRVRTKYPVGAVAIAENCSCLGCFRSLPPQLFNLVLAGGTLQQCPSCHRILVLRVEPTTVGNDEKKDDLI